MCLPSIGEAWRLSNKTFPNNHVYMVEGTDLRNLTALMRNQFPNCW